MTTTHVTEFTNQIATLALSFIATQKESLDQLASQMSKIQVKYDVVVATNNLLLTENANLQDTLSELKDEILNFKRVSQIIAYEKENARLKKEIELLRAKAHVPAIISVPPVQTIVSEEIELEFIEQTIDNIDYYVTDDKNKHIYEKLPDGDVGEHLGSIIKKKAVWNVRK